MVTMPRLLALPAPTARNAALTSLVKVGRRDDVRQPVQRRRGTGLGTGLFQRLRAQFIRGQRAQRLHVVAAGQHDPIGRGVGAAADLLLGGGCELRRLRAQQVRRHDAAA